MTQRLSARRVFAVYLIATALTQAAWILTLPAFRGIDEFDHVYKAAAVAAGQWTSPDPAPHGRGNIVTVPRSIVDAASPVCRSYEYVRHDNCFPIKNVAGPDVQVATAAAAYNPVFYAIVGTVARPFSGSGADFAMRAATALMCAILLAWAAALVTRWSTTAWPLITLTIGLTPVLLYSTSITGPNGVTYASAAVLWAGLMGLARSETDGRGLALPLTVSAVTLVATHTTGAMWLMLAVAAVATLRPLRQWILLLRQRRRTWILTTTVVGVTVAACLAWVRLAHTNALNSKIVETGPFPFQELPLFHTLWTLQAIAVFPLRDEQAPGAVYVIWGAALVGVLVALFRHGDRRERLAGLVVLCLLALVPTVLTAISYRTESFAWQGRYSLPLWLGITFLAGSALDKRGRRASPRVTCTLYALLTTAMTISTVHVGLNEISYGPTDPVVAGVAGGMVLVGVLAALGGLTPLAVLRDKWAVTDPSPSHQGASTEART